MIIRDLLGVFCVCVCVCVLLSQLRPRIRPLAEWLENKIREEKKPGILSTLWVRASDSPPCRCRNHRVHIFLEMKQG
jgi:hypothetical protein